MTRAIGSGRITVIPLFILRRPDLSRSSHRITYHTRLYRWDIHTPCSILQALTYAPMTCSRVRGKWGSTRLTSAI